MIRDYTEKYKYTKLNIYSFKRFSDLQRKVKELHYSAKIINIEQLTGKFFLYTLEVNND